jgi:hypothetical protein
MHIRNNNQKAAQLMCPITKALVPLSVIKYALCYQINYRYWRWMDGWTFHTRHTQSITNLRRLSRSVSLVVPYLQAQAGSQTPGCHLGSDPRVWILELLLHYAVISIVSTSGLATKLLFVLNFFKRYGNNWNHYSSLVIVFKKIVFHLLEIVKAFPCISPRLSFSCSQTRSYGLNCCWERTIRGIGPAITKWTILFVMTSKYFGTYLFFSL